MWKFIFYLYITSFTNLNILIVHCSYANFLNDLPLTSLPSDQVVAVEELIKRLIHNRANEFIISVNHSFISKSYEDQFMVTKLRILLLNNIYVIIDRAFISKHKNNCH